MNIQKDVFGNWASPQGEQFVAIDKYKELEEKLETALNLSINANKWSKEDNLKVIELEKKLAEAENSTEERILVWVRAFNKAEHKLRVAVNDYETIRDCAARYLDAADMMAKDTCDKGLQKALKKIEG